MVDAKNLRVIMAGSGNPYRVLNDRRKKLIRALHEAHELSEIQAMLDMDTDTLEADLNALLESTLIVKANSTYKPAFLVADHDETKRVTSHARSLGDRMHRQLLDDWKQLTSDFARLAISEHVTLRDAGLLFVGAVILDIGLLECLAQDASLMPPPPRRPEPDYPDSSYYLWMIEGETDDLGKYGQMTMPLPHDGWSFFTFGQYFIEGAFNKARRSLEKQVIESSEQPRTPEQLADLNGLLAVHKADIARWLPVVRQQSDQLLSFYKAHDTSIRDLHTSLRCGIPDTFGEFFCWYNHLVYSRAIDQLEQSGMIDIPDTRFMGTLWQDDSGPEFFASDDEK